MWLPYSDFAKFKYAYIRSKIVLSADLIFSVIIESVSVLSFKVKETGNEKDVRNGKPKS